MVKKLLGDAVREERLRRNLSQNSLAEQAKISLRTVFANESLQKVVEEGVIPNAYARYTWRGITLKNGEVAILTPSNNSMGLYCNSGRYITINYTLSRSAFHRSRVRAYVAGPSSEFVREITASGLRSGFTTQATDYYYGMVTNLSSDAFTIKSFSITF